MNSKLAIKTREDKRDSGFLNFWINRLKKTLIRNRSVNFQTWVIQKGIDNQE